MSALTENLEPISGGVDDAVKALRDGAVAHLVLNRPDKLNALGPQAIAQLRRCTEAIEADTSVRAVVVRGQGRVFCVGADLEAIAPLLGDPAAFNAFLDEWNDAYDLLAACSVPTVAAVQGMALAGGFELTHACDFVVAEPDALLGDQHANYGMFPAGGGIQRLARLIGLRRARWLLMSGERLDSASALAWGLVNEVSEQGESMARATEMAHLLATKSSNLNREIKIGLADGLTEPLAIAMERERPHAVAHMTSEDAHRGISAFRERSAPQFAARTPGRLDGWTPQSPTKENSP